MTDLDALVERLKRDRYVGGLERWEALRLANESPKHGLNGVADKEEHGGAWCVVADTEVTA